MPKALKDCLPFFLLFTIITIAVKNNGFFWDTIMQASKFGHYYFDSNFKTLLVPAHLDTGHPPLFGMYLAGTWKVFGKSLLVSHFAMLPFLLGIVWQVYRLIKYFTVDHKFLVLLLVLTNAVLLGHSTLVSPDIAFLFCFLLALNGILYLKKWQVILGTIGLGWLSIRGIFAIAALVGIHFRIDKKLKPLTVFIPVLLTTAVYYGYHFAETGWWLATPHEGWAHHRGVADAPHIFRNILVLGWWMLDFGNLALWLAFFLLAIRSRNVLRDRRMGLLLSIPIIIMLCYAPVLLISKTPIAHRYLLPFYLSFALLVGVWFTQSRFNKKWFFGLILLIQLSGNFWVYPRQIAKGWDCSIAHLPYYNLMNQMKNYIDNQQIEFQSIGTEFPNIGSRKYIELGEERGFSEKNMKEDEYILYSNVFNDFSDEALNDLDQNWTIQKQYSKGQVYVILYKRK